jgi:hypothetical protein
MPTTGSCSCSCRDLGSIQGFPFQPGLGLSASGINYRSLKAMKILQEMEKPGFPNIQ